jgi:hypothetical protein
MSLSPQRLITLLCLLGFPCLTYSQMDFQPRVSFKKEELISSSFPWLAKTDNREELNIFKLSCPACIEELKAAFNNDPTNVGLINLSTYKKEDRPIAQTLLATTLSYDDETKRKEVFGELLGLFTQSSNQFLRNFEEWQTLCLGFWNLDAHPIDDPKIWADALNWMDKQNRINMLLDMTQFPGSLELKEINNIPPITKETYRDGYSFVALSLPWLKYPDTHPVPGKPPSQNHPEQLPVMLINPLQQFSKAEWMERADTAGKGAFWHFVGDPEIVLHPRMLNFLAAFLDMPTDQERQQAFASAIKQIADERSRQKSFLATVHRIKEMPKARPSHEASRLAEARELMEDFLAYDFLRRE